MVDFFHLETHQTFDKTGVGQRSADTGAVVKRVLFGRRSVPILGTNWVYGFRDLPGDAVVRGFRKWFGSALIFLFIPTPLPQNAGN